MLKRVCVWVFLVGAIACSDSPSTAPGVSTTTTTVPPTVSSIAITGILSVTPGSPTSQLTATATLPDSTTQDVSALATWQSSNPAAVIVSSIGIATAVNNGGTTISATYGGQTGNVTVVSSGFNTFACPAGTFSHGSMSARINGVTWTASCVTIAELTPGSGALHISGSDNFSLVGQNIDIQLSNPGVGAFSNASGAAMPILAQLVVGGPGGPGWSTASGSASMTVDMLTAVGASGTFTFTLPAATGIANGTKVVTTGAFNITF